MKVALVGATGMTGRRTLPLLLARGHDVVVVGRNPEKLATLDPRAERRLADFDRPDSLPAALAGVDAVAYVAHAKHTGVVLAAMAPGVRLVVTGSVRIYTKLQDPAADAVRAGLDAFLASGRPGTVLLPAMIFGAPEDRNIGRLLRFFARIPAWLPVPVPLPDGGRHTVQPVHVDDVAAAVAAAVDRPNAGREPIVVAGPAPITYGELVRTCARALGRRAVILPVPVGLLTAFAAALAAVGLRAPFSPAELRRAAESKAFDVTRLHDELGIVPRGFAAGLAQKVAERAF